MVFRMLRNLLCSLSLLLFAAVSVLWARSYFVGDRFIAQWNYASNLTHHQSGFVTGHGEFWISDEKWSTFPSNVRSESLLDIQRATARPPYRWPAASATPTVWDWIGFHLSTNDSPVATWAIATPAWLYAIVTLMPPLVWARNFRRRRSRRLRLRHGHCVNCGYDLRASLKRCPECGKSVEPHADSATAKQPRDRLETNREKL
jgi:predicted Zn-ribbon and HTH transcriptional regulator